ncbi:putative GTP-binding protein 6 [Prionailurus iriomotensis]
MPDRQVAEAESLVHTLDRWSVVERMVVPTRTPDGKVPFSRGTLRHLTEKIRALPEITVVFLNVERMAPPTKKELEATWGVQVFDRFTVVLSIFRCNARTKEARLQVALAELPLLRSHLSSTTRLDGRGGGSRYIMGSGATLIQDDPSDPSPVICAQTIFRNEFPFTGPRGQDVDVSLGHRSGGESLMQVQRHLLKDKELKIRRPWTDFGTKGISWEGSADGGSFLWSPWWDTQTAGPRRVPHQVTSVVIECWTADCTPFSYRRKTTLIKALTGDNTIRPQDRLFATLDVTAHAGWLPSRVAVIYVDTISFLSQLPHSLIESFSAILEDVAHSDLVVHVRDVSRPETELQKASVPAALRGLRLPASLLDSVLEVHNKVDLVPGYSPAGSQAVAMSALLGHGPPELRARLEDAVLRATGRQVLMLRVRLAGAQLSWLHQEATVQDVNVIPDAGAANVRVVISSSAYSKFRKLFLELASQ